MIALFLHATQRSKAGTDFSGSRRPPYVGENLLLHELLLQLVRVLALLLVQVPTDLKHKLSLFGHHLSWLEQGSDLLTIGLQLNLPTIAHEILRSTITMILAPDTRGPLAAAAPRKLQYSVCFPPYNVDIILTLPKAD